MYRVAALVVVDVVEFARVGVWMEQNAMSDVLLAVIVVVAILKRGPVVDTDCVANDTPPINIFFANAPPWDCMAPVELDVDCAVFAIVSDDAPESIKLPADTVVDEPPNVVAPVDVENAPVDPEKFIADEPVTPDIDTAPDNVKPPDVVNAAVEVSGPANRDVPAATCRA